MESLAWALMSRKAQRSQQRTNLCWASRFSSESECHEVWKVLTKVSAHSIAAGQNTTLLLAKPSDKYSDLPRHPLDVQPPQECVGCKRDDGDPLECDKVYSLLLPHPASRLIYPLQCDAPWHLECLKPPLSAVPEGEWFCPQCLNDPGAPVGLWRDTKGNRKRQRADSPLEEESGKSKAGMHSFLRHRVKGRLMFICFRDPCCCNYRPKEEEAVVCSPPRLRS